MATYVALLYSVVLAPGRRVVMADLKALAAGLGYANPRTVLATGNLVFEAGRTSPSGIEAALEPAFAETFGRPIDIIVRGAEDWRRTVAANPFPEAAETDPSRLITRVMRAPLGDEILDVLAPYAAADERMAVANGDLWIHFGRSIASSRLSGAITPRRVGVGTARNWNTMCKIAALLG